MRKMYPLLAVTLLSSGLTLAWAAEEVTVTGDGQCAKCSLKQTKACQNAIVTADKVTYYLAKNKVSTDFHGNICKAVKKVKATGEVKEEEGKKVLTASKIELVD